MAFVITRLCRDCVDGDCVDECPVECIMVHRPPPGSPELPNQLFIDPENCISCMKCEPACPWQAIYDEDDVPPEFAEDVALNALAHSRAGEFDVAVNRLTERPSPEEVEANKRKWMPRDSAGEELPPTPD